MASGIESSYVGAAFRLFMLMTYYRKPINYTKKRMAEAFQIHRS